MSVADEFMHAAIRQAQKSRAEGGIPIGSALVLDNRLLAVGHNQRVQKNDPMTHAEIDCLRQAGRIRSFHGTVLYSTLMPCYLCAGGRRAIRDQEGNCGRKSNVRRRVRVHAVSWR